MSTYPFPRYAVGTGYITAALRDLKPGEFFYAPFRDVVEEFTVASQVLDLIFGPSKSWQETYQERFGDTVEMTLEYHQDRVYFQHWIGVRHMPRETREMMDLSPIGPDDISMKTKIKRELVEVPMLVDRRTGDVIGVAFR